MSKTPITRDDVRGRALAGKLSSSNPQEALKVARSIQHPWYRCQALSRVAEHWGTKAQKLDLLEEALASAQMQEDINRVITVSAWPLRVMVGIAPDAVALHLDRLVELGKGEDHTLRRADGLYAVAWAVRGSPELLAVVIPSLLEALMAGCGWRIDRLIRSTVDLVDVAAPEVVDQLIAHHSEGSKKRALIALFRKSSS
ncbi:MAG: hypothetical protein JSR66_01240 [Proteobacteria bacterium]|nr:hypothetical protein [Pseudomonadota bacterium]